jgi:phosphate starvation-inducible PhoH-like protein
MITAAAKRTAVQNTCTAKEVITRPSVIPRNTNQRLLIDKLKGPSPSITIATGFAGTAKTYLSTVVGLQQLYDGRVKKMIVTRPAVPAGEELGFLPGTLSDKMLPWLRPIMDSMHDVLPQAYIRRLMDDGTIEICPIAYCRGRTFNDAYILCDEVANITRLGENSKMVMTGDVTQSDLAGENGLADFLTRVGDGIPREIEVVRFNAADVVRHPVVKTVLALYNSE